MRLIVIVTNECLHWNWCLQIYQIICADTISPETNKNKMQEENKYADLWCYLWFTISRLILLSFVKRNFTLASTQSKNEFRIGHLVSPCHLKQSSASIASYMFLCLWFHCVFFDNNFLFSKVFCKQFLSCDQIKQTQTYKMQYYSLLSSDYHFRNNIT